jgi:hypothetical protein
MLAEVTWRSFLPTVFGPFLLSFWPTSSILKKPKLQITLKWFFLFQEVWSKLRTQVPEIRKKITKNISHFDSFCDCFELFVPVVLWFEKTKSNPNINLRVRLQFIQLVLLTKLDCAPYTKVIL